VGRVVKGRERSGRVSMLHDLAKLSLAASRVTVLFTLAIQGSFESLARSEEVSIFPLKFCFFRFPSGDRSCACLCVCVCVCVSVCVCVCEMGISKLRRIASVKKKKVNSVSS